MAIVVSRVGFRAFDVRSMIVMGGNFIIVDRSRAVIRVEP